MSEPLKVVSFRQTCEACPSQWEGHLEDGRMFYIRYRWSCGSVEVSAEPTNDVYRAVGGDYLLGFEKPDGPAHGMDGDLDTATMQQLTASALDWSGCPSPAVGDGKEEG